MSSFDLNHSFKFSYITTGLYMNGAISSDSHNTFKNWNLYLWSNDIPTSNPRVVIGLDFLL